MKKMLLFLGVFTMVLILKGQPYIMDVGNEKLIDETISKPSVLFKNSKGNYVDTVKYILSKSKGYRTVSVNSASSINSVCQYYTAPAPVTINGVKFYAYSNSGVTVNATASIYYAGTDSMPTGNALATVTIPVDENFYDGEISKMGKTGIFTTPVNVNQPYCVVISNPSENNFRIITNYYNDADGNNEWLASAMLGSTWIRSYELLTPDMVYFNSDFRIYPIVTLNIATSTFTPDQNCINSGTTVNFTLNASPLTSCRFYTKDAAKNQTSKQFDWYFNYIGSPNTFINSLNPSYTYTNVTSDITVALRDTLWFWTGYRTDIYTQVLSICTKTEKISTNTKISIYPNPAVNQLTIENIQGAEIAIYDIIGNNIYNTLPNDNIITIDTHNYTEGTYIIKIIKNDTVITRKFVIANK